MKAITVLPLRVLSGGDEISRKHLAQSPRERYKVSVDEDEEAVCKLRV